MWPQLIGDRFLQNQSGGWIDLATGARAVVAVREIEDDWTLIERRLQQEVLGATERLRPLLDFGRAGLRSWFEARANAAGAVSVVPDAS